MNASLILIVLSVMFLVAATLRYYRDAGRLAPASKTWFLVAAIFALVSGWLWLRT